MKQLHSKKIKFPTIDACSYKYIRSVEIAHLAEIRNSGEFNDKQVACIGSYCQLFTYLHAHVGKMEHIVKSDDVDLWLDQLYERIFQGYNLYLYESTHKGLYAFKNYSLIPLFDRFKYSPKWANFDLHMEHVIRLREQLYNAKFNSLNVYFNCHPFLHVIYNIRFEYPRTVHLMLNFSLFVVSSSWKYTNPSQVGRRKRSGVNSPLTLIDFFARKCHRSIMKAPYRWLH